MSKRITELHLVSVIITTKNSARTLGPLLKSIKRQTYKAVEIIVVDNASGDKTKEIARRYTKKVYDKGPERSAQRNFGAENSKGEFLLILDSDMVLTRGVVTESVEKLQNSKTLKLQIGGVVVPEKSFGRGFWAKVKAFEREINSGESFFESARFFPKEVFWEFGGYDENLTGPEDWDLPQRVARRYRIDRIDSFILHNEGSLSLKTLFGKKFYYGLSVPKYLKKQKLPLIGPTTVYFLRPAFYRNWQKLLLHPLLSLGLLIMLLVELFGGGLGFLKGLANSAQR